MTEKDIITTIQKARSIKPDKQWDSTAREAMLLYIQHTERSFFSAWKLPRFAFGVLVALAMLGSAFVVYDSVFVETNEQQAPEIVALAPVIQPETQQEQNVLSFLTYVTTNKEAPLEPEITTYSFEKESSNAFNEYLVALDKLSTIDESDTEALAQALAVVDEKSRILTSLLNIESDSPFQESLRIAVSYRRSQCNDDSHKQHIDTLLEQDTLPALIEAHTYSLIQCGTV